FIICRSLIRGRRWDQIVPIKLIVQIELKEQLHVAHCFRMKSLALTVPAPPLSHQPLPESCVTPKIKEETSNG
ncbi:MAG: hypothetical protein KDE58_31675, partial [Caldilineaceae bacterium]|nr:hypothetical protein [Caldilineaceae bacterium]